MNLLIGTCDDECVYFVDLSFFLILFTLDIVTYACLNRENMWNVRKLKYQKKNISNVEITRSSMKNPISKQMCVHIICSLLFFIICLLLHRMVLVMYSIRHISTSVHLK